MSVKITVLPGNRTFTAEGHSTLLEAGLHAGLALDYGCSNGNCGNCVARIVSGEVKKVRHHDFALSEQQHLNKHVLMCSNTALTDVTLEASEADGGIDIPLQQITAKVRALEFANNNVALLHLKTPRTKRLRFLAGQKVQLGGGRLPDAQYAIGSCPCDDMNLHFQIPRSDGNAFSSYVFEHLKKGDMVDINGPTGEFLLNECASKDLIFIAWRSGFAPVKSLIEHAMALELPQNIHLIWLAENPNGHYQNNLCRSWQDAFENVHYLPLDEGTVTISETTVAKLLRTSQKNLKNMDFYLADADGKTGISSGKLPGLR